MTAIGAGRRLTYSVAAAVVFALSLVGVGVIIGDLDARGFESVGLVMVAFGLLGALVLWRRPGNPMGWVFSGMGVSGLLAAVSPEAGIGALFGAIGWFTFFFLTVAVLPMVFPTGRLLSARWRWVMRGAIVAYACFTFLWIFQEQLCQEYVTGPDDRDVCVQWVDNPIGIPGIGDPESSVIGLILTVAFLLSGVAGLVSLGFRLRVARGVERQQLKWLLTALVALVGSILVVDMVVIEVLGLRVPEPVYDLIFAPIWLGLPVAAGLAIFRYGLYDIDRIISRAVAYALVVGVLTAGYLGAVVGIGALVSVWGPSGEDLGFPLPIVATALVAIAFQPVRVRARGMANRLVYGKRRTPYEALAGVGGASLDEVLPQIARLATESTAARRAVVWLSNGVELRPAAAHPDDGSVIETAGLEGGEAPPLLDGGDAFPLRHQAELLGAISAHLAPGEVLAVDDRRLLSDLATHAAVAVRGVLEAVPLPEGIVTFLMTDIEGSTRLWEDDPEAMGAAIRDHDLLVRRVVSDGGGVLIKWRGEGDSTFSVFMDAVGAVVTAVALQKELGNQPWPTPRPIRVRSALHTGEAELRERDYFGKTVNRCARLRALATGGQTLVSAATRELVREELPASLTIRDLGEHTLKDMTDPERVYEVGVT